MVSLTNHVAEDNLLTNSWNCFRDAMKRYNVYTDQDYASSRLFFFHYSRLEVSFSRIEVPCTFYLLHTHFHQSAILWLTLGVDIMLGQNRYSYIHSGARTRNCCGRFTSTCTARSLVWCFMFRSRACLGCYDYWNACVFGWIRPNPELAFWVLLSHNNM